MRYTIHAVGETFEATRGQARRVLRRARLVVYQRSISQRGNYRIYFLEFPSGTIAQLTISKD